MKQKSNKNESAAVLQVIERLVLNDSVSIEKVEKMFDMQERILNRNAHQAFTADLAAMQTELPLRWPRMDAATPGQIRSA